MSATFCVARLHCLTRSPVFPLLPVPTSSLNVHTYTLVVYTTCTSNNNLSSGAHISVSRRALGSSFSLAGGGNAAVRRAARVWGSSASGSGTMGELSTLPSVASSSDHFDLVCVVVTVGEEQLSPLPFASIA